jgi:hypothetical protein
LLNQWAPTPGYRSNRGKFTKKLAVGCGKSAKVEKTPAYRYVTHANIRTITFEKILARRI